MSALLFLSCLCPDNILRLLIASLFLFCLGELVLPSLLLIVEVAYRINLQSRVRFHRVKNKFMSIALLY